MVKPTPRTRGNDNPSRSLWQRLRLSGWGAMSGIVFVALACRLVVLAQLGGHPMLRPEGVLDDAVYVQMGQRVASGDLALGAEAYALAPFYTYFLGLIFALTGGSIAAARVVQTVLGAIAVALVMQTATEWFGKRAGVVAGALAALTGLLVFNEILILQSAVDAFLCSLALFALTRAVGRPSAPVFAAAGAAFGALALNRPNAVVCVMALPAIWLLLRRSKAAAWQAAALVLGASVLIAPFTIRNRAVSGEWVLITSHGGLNFYIGNGEGADGTWRAVDGISPSIEGQARDVRVVAGKALRREASSGEASDYFYALAWKWVETHPAGWLRLMARKTALFFNATDVALNYSYTYFSRDESSLLSVLIVGPWLILPLGIFGLVAGAGRPRDAYVTWAAFAPVYALSVIAFFVSSRYRLPLLVPLLAGSGAAVDRLIEWARVRAERRRLLAAAGLVALFVFVNWPMSIDDGRLRQSEEVIIRLITDGRLAEAEARIARMEAVHPRRDVVLYRVGLAFRDGNDWPRALKYLQRALDATPANEGTQAASIEFDLGEGLLQQGRAGDAIPHLEHARRGGVRPATSAYELAEAYRLTGQLDKARASLASMLGAIDANADGLVNLAEMALALEDPLLADAFARRALQQAPGAARAHELLGSALVLQGRREEGIAELERAVTLDPASASAYFHLALSYAEAQKTAAARAALERVLALDPANEDARALLGRLK
jgi:tetratricopeptide (TPR) repeat protein